MRVAVASSDGIVINQHFGRADSFYIYEVSQGEEPVLMEKRIGRPFCHGGNHEETELQDATELLADCRRVYVAQIGRGAELELARRGIQSVTAPGLIHEVLTDN